MEATGTLTNATLTPDPAAEIAAMSRVTEALQPLSEDARERVLEWVNRLYRKPHPKGNQKNSDTRDLFPPPESGVDLLYADFPGLLATAVVASGLDRALLGAFFLQVVQRQQDFDAFSLNRELKNAGYPSLNVTRDLDSLMGRTPQLVIQTKKSGSSKQARKLYRLTAAGISTAKELLQLSQS